MITGIDTNSSTWGVYLQDDIQLSDKFSLNIGIRYDQFSNTASSTNPRIAAIWHPYNDSTFKFIYGTAYRAPSVYELTYHDSGISQKAPDSLNPEDTTSYEVIFEHKLTENINLIVSLYKNDIKDLIALTTDVSDDLLVFKNRDNVSAEGGEIELQGQWQSGWRGAMSYSNSNSKYTTTLEQLPNTPRYQFKLNILTPTFMNGISAGLNMQYEDARKTFTGKQTDNALLTNITVLKANLLTGLNLSIGAYNLFDKKYSHPSSEEHYQDKIEQYGRTYRMKINYSF